MKRSAFTLIELLVVIAIIAVLAGIAVPVFQGVQEKARATSDASNLRQIGIGLIAYLNDNDEILFDSSEQDWPSILHDKSVENWKVFYSPFDPRGYVEPAAPASARVSYGIASNLYGNDLGKLESLSQAILAAPSFTGDVDLDASWVGTGVSSLLTAPTGAGVADRGTHRNGNRINALFADSHIEDMASRDFTDAEGTEGELRWPNLSGDNNP